jgi:hypothetical protein
MNTSITLHTKALRQYALPCRFSPRFILLGLIALVGSALAQSLRAQDGDYGNNNTAEGNNALTEIIFYGGSGTDNTAIGYQALGFDSTGSRNTAIGSQAMGPNPTSYLITGNQNTATGFQAMYSEKNGLNNVANGAYALFSNTSGNNNIGIGYLAQLNNQTGENNIGIGSSALDGNKTGTDNIAIGSRALDSSDQAADNTAIGSNAMSNSTTGSQNTAIGSHALYGHATNGESDSTGSFNTATGFEALFFDKDGGGNVANGWLALYSNTNGAYNTGVGTSALRLNTAGNQNTAIGTNALYHSTGSNNVALGYQSGQNLTTGSNNIIIGAGVLGSSGDNNITRIGKTTQVKTFIGGIFNIPEPPASGIKPVYINSNGQLGTTPPASSARFKEAIKPMEKASESILSMKPVTFRYKNDTERTPEFGLIAEEVAKLNPDLVVRDQNGEIYTVRYDAVNAMLLNEFLKEHRKVAEQARTAEQQEARLAKQEATNAELKTLVAQQQNDFKATIAQQQKQIEALTAGVGKIAFAIELNKPAAKVANQ